LQREFDALTVLPIACASAGRSCINYDCLDGARAAEVSKLPFVEFAERRSSNSSELVTDRVLRVRRATTIAEQVGFAGERPYPRINTAAPR
jgi:hypothetical protein